MKDYAESFIKLNQLLQEYQKAVLKGQFEAAADIAVDMQIAVVNLQEWAEHQCTETPNS
jgi:hypothetical protein